MSHRSDIEQTGRKARYAAIRRCRHCDPCGWRLLPDGTPIDPAVRCDHNSPPSAPASGRDITEPIHKPDLFSEPLHDLTAPRSKP
ncbi:hypothetical protein [Mycolicibacterium helvum]|uniref:Uncharacterized protein n=1 Tax=Mycolicibacterium helvum TaxID=1534349 RepID=A0A7I7TGR7_9MYCO|nr:hypothetical protein [Mycolicibacterium helvum]BBY67559.1 hypothetical protein MHEL_58020 [Mycolicibacterium helvum]